MRRLSSFERFCAAAFNVQYRHAERKRMTSPVHYPGGLAVMPSCYHCVTPDSTFVAGSTESGRFAAEREQLRARGERGRTTRPVLAVTVFLGLVGAGAVAFFAYAVVATIRDGGDPIGTVVVGGGLLLSFAWMLFQLMVSIGRHFYMVDAMQQWAERLGGASGFDTVDPVVVWVTRFWPWFLPPHFLSAGTMWATGWQAGRSILLVSEREESWMISSTMNTLATVGEEHRSEAIEVPTSVLCRLSLFIAGAVLRKEGGAASAVQELGAWGYGVVTTPAGVYLYGLAYERGLHPRYLSAVVDKIFSALEPVGPQIPSGA